jgi:hypothetical protein
VANVTTILGGLCIIMLLTDAPGLVAIVRRACQASVYMERSKGDLCSEIKLLQAIDAD